MTVPLRAGVLDTVGGLPAHPLVVHFAVGLVVLAALTGVAAVLLPRRRNVLVPASAVVSVLAAAACLLATQTGESLQERVGDSAVVQRHAELGEQTRTITLVLAALTLVWSLLERSARRARERSAAAEDVARQDAPRSVTVPENLFAPHSAGAPDDDFPDPAVGTVPGGRRAGAHRPKTGVGAVGTVLAVSVLVTSLLAGTWVYRAGEEGARAVWGSTPSPAGNP